MEDTLWQLAGIDTVLSSESIIISGGNTIEPDNAGGGVVGTFPHWLWDLARPEMAKVCRAYYAQMDGVTVDPKREDSGDAAPGFYAGSNPSAPQSP